MGELQNSPDVLIAESVERIQIHPQGPGEQHRILVRTGLCMSQCLSYNKENEKQNAACELECSVCLCIFVYLWYDREPVSEVMQAY